MKGLIFICLLVVAVSAFNYDEEKIEFTAWKLKHGKTYRNQAEEMKRFTIFTDNLRSIEEHNLLYKQGYVSYKQGINKFTDMTREEFRAFLGLNSSNKPHFNTTKYVKSGLAIPDSVDWRTEGQVTEVKDQGFCSSCWAYCITGSTEAAYFRQSGNLVALSEQQLVDCTTDINGGCDGGYLDLTFPYIKQNGLESEQSYPYTAVDGSCQYSASKVVTKISEFHSISGDENALLEAVGTIGPVSVGMDATYLSSYKSGIYEDSKCSPEGLNHCVLIVGYGSENGKDFWIVKNSWGTSFGDDGYFKIARGQNECGISVDTGYPSIN